VTATDEIPPFTGSRAVDLGNNTDWRFNDTSPVLSVAFEVPIDLGWVIVKTGNTQDFANFRRPVELTLEFPDGSEQVLALADTKDDQVFEVKKDDIESVTVQVAELRGPEDKPISITEIEFQAKQPPGTPAE
jgi:hypothetical protein